MLKAYIVDDEPLARDELAYILRRTKRVEVAGEAGTIEKAIAEVEALQPDVVFVDIQLNENSGIQLAEQLKQLPACPHIVFATAYDEYAIKAFEMSAADYLLKPFDEKRISQCVERMIALNAQATDEGQQARGTAPARRVSGADKIDKLAVSLEDRILLIPLHKVISLASEEGKTTIVTEDGSYKVSEPLVAFEQKLLNTSIVRVHRAYLVNLDAITEIQPWFNSTFTLIMKDGSSVPVSRSHMKDIKGYIGF